MSAVMKLPIEPILGSRPQKFKWKQRIDNRIIECEGVLPASVEGAITELIALAKYTSAHLADLKKDKESLQELLVQAQERIVALEAQQIPQTPAAAKKDKK